PRDDRSGRQLRRGSRAGIAGLPGRPPACGSGPDRVDWERDRGGRTVKLSLSIDRFEGDKMDLAVLLSDDGDPIHVPKKLLPKGAKAGDVLAVTIERDEAATRAVASKTKAAQDDLRKTDHGGDIKL